MPHQFGLPGFGPAPPSPSPPSHHARIGNAVVPQGASAAVFRPQIEDKRLTRDAMERYMRERNDMVIVILHAKVNRSCQCLKCFFETFCLDRWTSVFHSGCSKVLWK